MKNLKKLMPYLMASILGLGVQGCATQMNSQKPIYEEKQAVVENHLDYASRILGCRPEFITRLPEGYITDEGTAISLRSLAGLYAGTVHAKRTKDGRVFMSGSYSLYEHPEAMILVSRSADENGDKVITFTEEDALSKKVLENIK